MNIFLKASLKARLYFLLVLMIAGLVALGAFSAWQMRQHMLQEKRQATRALVDAGVGVMQVQYVQFKAGTISEDEAKTRAKDALRKSRFNGGDYFFIYDLAGNNVMHGSKPEREGQNFLDATDPTGKVYYKEWIELLKRDGVADMDYFFPKPGSKDPVPKVSYARVFTPWGWWLATGVYIDDVDAAFRKSILSSLIFLAAAAAVLGVLAWQILRSVRDQLGGEPALAARQVEQVATGDLTQTIVSGSTLEGNLLGALAAMQKRLHDTVQHIRTTTETLSREAGDLSLSASEISVASGNQAESASAVAAAIEELTVSISEVTELSRVTEKNSLEATQLADSGAASVKLAAKEIERIADSVRESTTLIESLSQRSLDIGKISSVIKEIADQTNLLALNAAIEAARAGEQGRGFAVVADEVRKLAERTAQATTEIARMIDAIRNDTQQAVTSMEQTVPLVRTGQEHAGEASRLLDRVQQQAQHSLANARDVAHATAAQATAANDIARHMEAIATMTDETNAATASNSEAAQKLKELAAGLEGAVGFFKV